MIERCLGHAGAARTWFRPRARPQPALLAALGAGRAEVRVVKRFVVLVAVVAVALLAPLRGAARTRSATSRSTATAASSSRATASTSSTCSTSPRSRPSRPSRRCGERRGRLRSSRLARRRAPRAVDGRPAPLVAAAARARLPAGRRRAAHDAPRGRPRAARGSSGTSRIAYRDSNYAGRIGWQEIVVRRRGRRRRPPAHRAVSDELLAYPKNLLQSPLDVSSARAPIDPGPTTGPPPGPARGKALEQRVAVRAVADSGFASLIVHDHLSIGFVLALAADRDVLGRGARPLARPRQVDRRRLPRRLTRHAAARGLPRADRDGHAHDRRLRARAGHAQPLRVHRPRPALPVAEPRLGAPDRRRRAQRAPLARARVAEGRRRPTTITTATSHGHSHGHHHHHDHDHALSAAACSGSASPAGSSRARRRSSSCSRRSRCTGSATGSS